jgi:quercetin dioxygenase-like cupin family protein
VSPTPAHRVVAVADAPLVRPIFGAHNGCDLLEQAVIACPPGVAVPRSTAGAEETLYVLSGTGELRFGATTHRLAPETGAAIAPGQHYVVEGDGADGLELLSVRLTDPVAGSTAPVTVIGREQQEHGNATADREFRLVLDPERGCLSATLFVGVIPPGRAPEHYHHYDEVIYVLEGTGSLHLESGAAAVGPGSCIHLPARLKHSLENGGDAPMEVLGVFRPAGSPSEAYYPDGTPAMTQHGGSTR